MAKKKSDKSNTNEWKKADWKGFKDVGLTVEAKQQFQGWDIDAAGIVDALEVLASTGHKVSVTAVNDGKGFSASLTGSYEHCINAGYTMAAFAPSAEMALQVVIFKHFVLCDEVWDSYDVDTMSDIG